MCCDDCDIDKEDDEERDSSVRVDRQGPANLRKPVVMGSTLHTNINIPYPVTPEYPVNSNPDNPNFPASQHWRNPDTLPGMESGHSGASNFTHDKELPPPPDYNSYMNNRPAYDNNKYFFISGTSDAMSSPRTSL